jgi:hypothetical protein
MRRFPTKWKNTYPGQYKGSLEKWADAAAER